MYGRMINMVNEHSRGGILMVKRCKQCGVELKPGENNNVCTNCRELKKVNQAQVRKAFIDAKKNKGKKKKK